MDDHQRINVSPIYELALFRMEGIGQEDCVVVDVPCAGQLCNF